MDRTSDVPQQIEVSDNKELVHESMRVFLPGDNTDNSLKTYLMNNDNINEIVLQN